MAVVIRTGEEAACWEYLLTSAAERLKKDKTAGALIVVSSMAQARRFSEDLLARSQVGGIGWLRVHTLLSLAEDIFRRAGKLHARIVPSNLKTLLLEQTLKNEELQYFASMQGFYGFVEKIGDFLAEIIAFNITPEELQKTLDDNPRNRDIVRLYKSYRDTLHSHKLCEKSDVLYQASEFLEKDTALLGGLKDAFVFGFTRFSTDEETLLRTLCRFLPNVELLVDQVPPDRGLFSPAAALIESHWMTDASVDRLTATLERVPQLEYLVSTLFDQTPADRLDAGSAIQVLSGAGSRGEMEMIAREIRHLVGTANYQHSDILVIARSLNDIALPLMEILGKFEIPADISLSVPVLQIPLIAAVLSLVETVTENWPREKVLRTIRSSYVGIDPDDAALLEMSARAKGIFSGRNAWLSSFEPESLRAVKEAALSPLVRLEKELAGSISAEAFRRALKETLAHSAVIARTVDGGDRNRTAVALRGLDLLSGVLDELTNAACILGSSKLKAEEWLRLLKDGLANESVSFTVDNANGVRIRSVVQASTHQAKVVFICNLVEGGFPLLPRERFLLRDKEIRKISEKSALKLQVSRERPSEERFLFYQTVSRASERLYLTHTACDSNGKPVLRSFFVDEVIERFQPGSVAVKTQDLSHVVPSVCDAAAPCDVELSVLQGVRQLVDTRYEHSIREASLVKWLIAKSPAGINLQPLLESAQNGGTRVFDLSNPVQAPMLERKSRYLDASSLDTFGACPFKFYCSRILGIMEIREGVDPLSEGSIIHSVLERLIYWMLEYYGDARFTQKRLPEILNTARVFIEETIDNSEFREEKSYRVKLMRQRLLKAMERFIPLEAQYQVETGAFPKAVEVRFGPSRPGTADSPMSLDTSLIVPDENGKPVYILGKIDRVDELPNGKCILIDYKSSAVKPSLKEIVEGRSFQLPLYLMAARGVFGWSPACAVYVGLRKGGRSGIRADGSKSIQTAAMELIQKPASELEQPVTIKVLEYSRLIRDGAFAPKPAKNACKCCDFATICRHTGLELESETAEE